MISIRDYCRCTIITLILVLVSALNADAGGILTILSVSDGSLDLTVSNVYPFVSTPETTINSSNRSDGVGLILQRGAQPKRNQY